MKHIFVIIDNLIIYLDFLPLSLDGKDNKSKAEKALKKLEKYNNMLGRIVSDAKSEENLEKLRQVHNSEKWVGQLKQVFEKLDALSVIIEKDIETMRRIAKKEPEKWKVSISNMALGMVKTGLHEEKEELQRIKKASLYKITDIRKVVSAEEQLEIIFG